MAIGSIVGFPYLMVRKNFLLLGGDFRHPRQNIHPRSIMDLGLVS